MFLWRHQGQAPNPALGRGRGESSPGEVGKMPSKAEGLAGGEEAGMCHHRRGGQEGRGSLAMLVRNVGRGGAETRHRTCLSGAHPESTGVFLGGIHLTVHGPAKKTLLRGVSIFSSALHLFKG